MTPEHRKIRKAVLPLVFSLSMALPPPALAQESDAGPIEPAQQRVLGELTFPTTAQSEPAQAAFIQGMLLLHLFEYPFAREQFQRAQQLEPGFAMAIWGEAMTHNHPIWDEQDRDAARLALSRLGATPLERQEATEGGRERLLIDALETLYGEGPKAERDRAYMRKMEQLAARFPEDHEMQLFYALAVFGVHAGVRDIDSYMLATAIADAVLAENPQHPGAAHYMIHGVDDPVHAVLGLRAARALAAMAPDAAHAQHMASHIFLALGMWDDVVIANEAAVRVRNRMRAGQGMAPSSYGHSNFWLIYGYLQQGRFGQARALLNAAHEQVSATESPQDPMELDPDRSPVGSVVQMWLRYLVETGEWDGPVAEWRFRTGDAFDPNLNYNFAQAVRAARASLPSQAREQLGQFQRLTRDLATRIGYQEEPAPTDLMYLKRLDIMEQQILALIEASKGDFAAAVPFAREASRLEGELPRAFGPPYVDLPSAQLLGEMQAAAGDTRAAIEAFKLELQRNRQRTAPLMGLAQAYQAVGEEAEAGYYRFKLATLWHLADEEVREGIE